MRNKTTNNLQDKNKLKAYGKYSGLAFQMLAIILLGTFGSIQLDNYLALSFPIFTIIGVILSVVIAMYFAVKDLLKK